MRWMKFPSISSIVLSPTTATILIPPIMIRSLYPITGGTTGGVTDFPTTAQDSDSIILPGATARTTLDTGDIATGVTDITIGVTTIGIHIRYLV